MRQFGVIGLGRFGFSVAKTLSEKGHQVLGVDVDEDKQFKARTIPVCFGLQVSRVIVMVSLALTLGLNVIIFYLSPVDFAIIYVIISFAVGCYLLLLPAVKLFRTRNASDAIALFNKASYYPPALFAIVLVRLVL